MLDEGLATVWNANNPSRVIVAGDRILEVNGESMSPEDWKNVDTVSVDSICVKPHFQSWNSLDRRQLSRGVNERFLRLYSHECIWPATYKTDHGHQESCAFSSGHGEKVQSSG